MTKPLPKILRTVNEALPTHGRGIISPHEMLATSKASCFGRLSLVAAGLELEGVPAKDIFMLTTLNHGLPYAANRHWLGHIELVVDQADRQPTCITASHTAYTVPIEKISWPASSQELPLLVVKYSRLTGPKPTADELRELEPIIGPPDIAFQGGMFAVRSLEEGIDHYQAAHPAFANQPAQTLQDYAAFYEQLAHAGGPLPLM